MSEQKLSESDVQAGLQKNGTNLDSANEVSLQTLKREAVTPAAAAEENCDALSRHRGLPRHPPTKRPRTSSPPITTPSVKWHNEIVSQKRETKADAEERVLKLRLACVAFESKLQGKDKTHLNATLEKIASRFHQVPVSTKDELKELAVTYYNDILENIKVEATRRLESATTELREANAELTEAKSELKEAEAALEKAKTEVNVAELKTYVEAAWSTNLLKIASLSAGAVGKAQGMVELVKVMTEKLQTVEDLGRDFVRQRTIAFALTSSSGVGKTFFSLAAAKPLSKALFGAVGTLYLGFNSDAPLQENEIHFLEESPTYKSVQLVLYRRLLIQLECLLAWKQEAGTCKPFEFDCYGLQHVVKMKQEALVSLPLLAKDVTAAKLRTLNLLKDVQKAFKLSHLMLVIDEGQKLDTLIKPDISRRVGGARFALHWTRMLQLEASNGKCGLLCFGLMTGIDPQTSVRGLTDGTNHELWHMPMERDDFKNLTKDALEGAIRKKNANSGRLCNVALSEPLINLVAASYFPLARAVSTVQLDDEGKVTLPLLQIRCKFDKATRKELVIAGLARFPLDNTEWATEIPSAWTDCGDRFPCLSYATTVELLHPDIFSSLPRDKLAVDDCFEFETLAAATIRLLIWIRGEVSRNKDRWPLGEQLMKQIFPDHSTVCSRMELAFPDTIRGCFPLHPPDAKQMYYPSSNCKSHNDAFVVVTEPPPHPQSPELADKFKESTDGLHNAAGNDANTLFFHCGASAPIDFVILHKTDNTTWQLTLADAKHTSKEVGSKPATRDMASRGDRVFRYLEHQLKKIYHVTLKWDRTVLLLTNATCGEDDDDGAVSRHVPSETPQAEPVTIVLLTPSTFQMGSVTDYLFARCASVAPGGKKLEEDE